MTLCGKHWEFHGDCTDQPSPWLPWAIVGACLCLLVAWLVLSIDGGSGR